MVCSRLVWVRVFSPCRLWPSPWRNRRVIRYLGWQSLFGPSRLIFDNSSAWARVACVSSAENIQGCVQKRVIQVLREQAGLEGASPVDESEDVPF